MAENKPEGPAGDFHREILWKLPKLTEKLKNTKISSFVNEKLKKQKPKIICVFSQKRPRGLTLLYKIAQS
jgi:hypothetical protein